jgi:tetratricopeptide (TPR) repeat protein
MKNRLLLLLILLFGFNALAQKSQLQIAKNSLGKLQASITSKADSKKQLAIIGEGIKALEVAQKDKKTKNWAETWAIKAYLSSYVALIDDNTANADKYYGLAIEAIDQANKLDKFQDNSGLIKASSYNINIKKQTEGNRAFDRNDFVTAFDLLKQVSDYLPTDTTIAINVALCAQNIKDYNEALNYFKRAKENGVKNPLVYQNMANIYASKFESELAIKTLEEGLKLNPYHPFLLSDYINQLLDNEKYDKAIETIETSIAADKRGKLLLFLYGYLQQSQLNNNTNAEFAYKKALDQDQSYFDALYQLGIVYINYANDALKEKNKQKFNSYINRAEFTLLRAHEINQNDRNTIKLLIEIYTRKNRLDKVQDLRRKFNEF